MGTKEFKVQVPEGYEIDREKSTLKCIKFKPIGKKLTYEDVAKELFEGENRYITTFSFQKGWKDATCTSSKQTEKLIAINKILNVAKYLNGTWSPNWDNDKEYKYWIGVKECYSKELYIEHSSSFSFSFTYFKSEGLARQAIEILGEETIKTALSADY